MTTVIAVDPSRPPSDPGLLAGALDIMPFLAFGLPLAYALALVVGLPMFFFFRRSGQLRLIPILVVTALLGGTGVAIALGLLFSGWEWSAFLLGIPVGLAVGLTFWFIGVRERSPVRVA